MSNLRVPFSASRSVPHFLLIHFACNTLTPGGFEGHEVQALWQGRQLRVKHTHTHMT